LVIKLNISNVGLNGSFQSFNVVVV
jgi:hypothetical protein